MPFIISCAGSFLPAQEAGPAIPPLVAKKALQWMQNSDVSKRAAAYRTFQLYGDEGGSIYRRTLEKARTLHEKKLADILSDERSNPFLDLPDISEKLKGHRARIYKLIKTDYKKQPDKIAMLRHEVEILQKINGRARMIAENDPASLDKAVKGIATALAEVSREVNIIDETEFDRNQLDLDDALMSIYEGEVHLKNRKVITNIRKEIESLVSARLDNNASGWASVSQKTSPTISTNFVRYLRSFHSA